MPVGKSSLHQQLANAISGESCMVPHEKLYEIADRTSD